MMEFKRIKATKKSFSQRKPLYGIGINDADYLTEFKRDGFRVSCPYYKKWSAMIERCYSVRFKESHESYSGCKVCDDWIYFSKFREWMESQDWKGKELDKDIRRQGNRIYSPENCQFVSSSINTLFNDYKRGRGKFMRGVSFLARTGKYKATISIDSAKVHLGYYSTELEAFNAYKDEKYKNIKRIAMRQIEPLKSEMLNYKIAP
jgi:hypothetical protein